MADPFLGQLMLVGFNFAPTGYALAAGQILSISQYTALFSLFGTYYGGNGIANFAVPNLQGNCAVGMGQGNGLSPYNIGQIGGSSSVTLGTAQIPSHSHTLSVRSSRADQTAPNGNLFALSEAGNIYNSATGPTLAPMSPSVIPGNFGGNGPHNNVMPYQVLNWIVAMTGIYPTRS